MRSRTRTVFTSTIAILAALASAAAGQGITTPKQ